VSVSRMKVQSLVGSDIVETEIWLKLRDRDFIKNPETRDLKFKTETSKFVHFAEFFFLNVVTSKLIFFQISAIFLSCFDCSLPANTTNVKSLNYRNFTIPVLRNSQSLETSLPTKTRPETFTTGTRQKWVSRLHHCL